MEHDERRRFVGYVAFFLAVLVVSAAGIVLGGGPAHAATGRAVPPPGAGYSWGIPIASLPTDCSVLPSGGGWSERDRASSGRVTAHNYPMRPMAGRLSEPCYRSGNPNGARFRLDGQGYSLAVSSTPVSEYSNVSYGATTNASRYLICATTEWSQAAGQTVRTANGASSFQVQGPPSAAGGVWAAGANGQAAWGNGITDANCPFLVAAVVALCTWDQPVPQNTIGTETCITHSWSAEHWFQNKPYDDAAQDVIVCQAFPNSHPDCIYIDPPGGIDGTNFDIVCALAPVWGLPVPGDPTAWVEYFFSDLFPYTAEFVGATVGHYARCLFVPINGFDRESWVADAWENGVAGEVAAAASDAATAYQWGENCGTLFAGTGQLEGIDINTCTWSWALPIKTVIGWGLTAVAAFFLIGFVLRTIAGVLNKKVPTPLGGDES